MQPQMSFERGYCRPECVECGAVCPAGAIRPMTAGEKTTIQVGHAVWTAALCIVNRDNLQGDNCARHCPTGAIRMVKQPDAPAFDDGSPASLLIPVVNEAKCIGCGACENLCPSNPLSAMRVEGHEEHQSI
jgi:Fe-S-cluster-containing hydrogenase component 2